MDFTATAGYTYSRFIFAYAMPFIAVYLLIKGLKDRKAAQAQPAAPVAEG
jgi:hypothetical protein